jgi:hypothetical protein
MNKDLWMMNGNGGLVGSVWLGGFGHKWLDLDRSAWMAKLALNLVV